MKQQTIIITDATSGIGQEIARHFIKNGDNIVINALNPEKLNQVFYQLGAGENLAMVAGNVSDRVTGIKLVAVAVGKFGSADVLVNNAGIFETKSFLNVDEAYLDRFLDINLKGAFFATQGIIPQMVKQRDGVVINIGTPLINRLPGGGPAATLLASKSALHSLTIQLAAEFGKHNIRFNTIALGTAQTPMHGYPVDSIAGLHLLNRTSEAEDIARMVYAVSKSDFVNGTIVIM